MRHWQTLRKALKIRKVIVLAMPCQIESIFCARIIFFSLIIIYWISFFSLLSSSSPIYKKPPFFARTWITIVRISSKKKRPNWSKIISQTHFKSLAWFNMQIKLWNSIFPNEMKKFPSQRVHPKWKIIQKVINYKTLCCSSLSQSFSFCA